MAPKINPSEVPAIGPRSPWAERYGESPFNFWRKCRGPIVHSNIAPELPRLEPNEYAKEQDSVVPIPEPSLDELDALFFGEKLQRRQLTWAAGALNGVLHAGISGVHDVASAKTPLQQWDDFLEHHMMEINEEAWIPLFRKDHWYDHNVNPLDDMQNPVPNIATPKTVWSVDNPVIWNALRPSIQLANNILRELQFRQSRWLKDLIWAPRAKYMSCCTNPNLSRSQREAEMCLPHGIGEIVDEINRRGEHIVLAIADESALPNDCNGFTTSNKTNHKDGQMIMIVLIASTVRPLLSVDSTVAERCMATFMAAQVLVHEFAHAIYKTTLYFPVPAGIQPATATPNLEPFMFAEWICELGMSLENEIFGGIGKTTPAISGRVNGITTGQSLCMTYSTFLNMLDRRQIYGSAIIDRTAAIKNSVDGGRLHVVPTFWISFMLSRQYWLTVVPRLGLKAFKPPLLLEAFATRGQDGEIFSARRSIKRMYDIEELRHDINAFESRWRERLDSEIRGDWYEDRFHEWRAAAGPWNAVLLRNDIDTFRYFHSLRNWNVCHRRANVNLSQLEMAWQTEKDGGVKMEQSAVISLLVQLLMMSAIPQVINPPAQVPAPLGANAYTYYTPSLEALKARGNGFIGHSRSTRSSPPTRYTQTVPLLHRLNTFWDVFVRFEFDDFVPVAWLDELIEAYKTIRAEREADPDVTKYTSFPLKIPPYDPLAATAISKGQHVSTERVHRWHWVHGDLVLHHQLSQGVYRAESPGGRAVNKAAATSASQDGPQARAALMMAGTQGVGTVYFHVSDVGNHRELDDAWVVHSDGDHGFDVFNITDTLRQLGSTDDDYRAIVRISANGPQLIYNDVRADTVRSLFYSQVAPLGKLIMRRHLQEICEFNGQNGRPAWTYVGPYVFDITSNVYFPFMGTSERDLLRRCAGARLAAPLTAREPQMEDLLHRLRGYICAYIDYDVQIPTTYQGERVFTEKTLAWMDNPNLGFCMAIGGVVYDVSGYLNFHPGGYNILYQYFGRDATDAFSQFHTGDVLNQASDLLRRVGKLVPEVTINDLRGNHIVIYENVYDTDNLSDADIKSKVLPYLGTDASPALAGPASKNDGLRRMVVENPDCVVARVARSTPTDIPNGEFAKHNDPTATMGAWVAVRDGNGYGIFNVGDLMMYPECYGFDFPSHWAGQELTDPALINRLQRDFHFRHIGRLVEGPEYPLTPPTPVPTPDIDDDIIICGGDEADPSLDSL
ncbi:hypothetical protein F5Y15DRAFT_380074 [Xylariaceae sp. FL0016]|nr:hypothetical protein F5Y15DRAFT_380074 [Xylariaceae sp. FL0016]